LLVDNIVCFEAGADQNGRQFVILFYFCSDFFVNFLQKMIFYAILFEKKNSRNILNTMIII